MHDPDELNIKRGGGCLSIFGLPFFLFGLAFLIVSISGSVKSSGGGAAPMVGTIPFSLVFLTLGVALVFGRAGVRVNRREKTVTTWWGLLFLPLSSKRRSAEAFDMVSITKEVRRSKNSTYTVYPVKLTGKEESVKIEEPRQYDAARTSAERIAKFMDLGVRDAGRGETVVREAGTLDESLRDRFKRLGRTPEMPEQPSECKSVQSVEGDEAAFDIPAPGFGALHLLAIGGGVLFSVIVLLFFVGPFLRVFSDADGKAFLPAIIGMGVFCIFPVLLAVVPVLFAAKTRDRVVVSTRGIRLIRRYPIGGTRKEIPADELEELTLAKPARKKVGNLFASGRLVSARSDREIIEFGAGLSAREVAWLRDVVEFLVTAPEGDG